MKVEVFEPDNFVDETAVHKTNATAFCRSFLF